MKLSTKAIQALRPTDRRQEIKDDGCRGLYLLVQPSGTKGWAVRYSIDGKLRKATLGPFPQMGLAEARIAAGRVFEQLAGNVDPREAERQAAAEAREKRASTFGVVARRFLADNRHLRSIDDISRRLKPIIAEWEDRPIAAIRRRDVIELLDDIKARRGPYAAVGAACWLKRIFYWSVDKAIVEASPMVKMKPPAPARVRERCLSDDELKRLWIACGEEPFPFGAYVRLLALSGCRRGELASLTWADVDLSERTVVIPGRRCKSGKPHLIPLSRQALNIIQELPQFTGPHVFGSAGEKAMGGFHWRQSRLDARIDPPLAAWGMHDVRRTVRTGLARLRIPESVAERVLGHAPRGLERHYNMHQYADEKRQALQLWADHITRLVDGDAAAGKVVALTR